MSDTPSSTPDSRGPKRLGLQLPPTSTPPESAPAEPTAVESAPAEPARHQFSGRALMIQGVALVAVIAVVAAAGWWWKVRSDRVDLRVFGNQISNPSEILESADQVFRSAADKDGAPLDDEARCFFGRVGHASKPSVVCGPVWFGSGRPNKPWLAMDVKYSTSGSGQVRGDDVKPKGAMSVELESLVRPDGAKPIRPGEPAYSTTGPRLSSGLLIESPDVVLEKIESAFAVHLQVTRERAVANDTTRCFFVRDDDIRPGTVTYQRDVQCGPVLGAAAATAQWVSASVPWESGSSFGLTTIAGSSNPTFGSLAEFDPDDVLERPDGQTAGSVSSLTRPAQAADLITVTTSPIAGLTRADGRLVSGGRELLMTARGRAEMFGTGASSWTAAPGYQLVVARFATDKEALRPRGYVRVDNQQMKLPSWPSTTDDESVSLVVSVPSSATRVDLVHVSDRFEQSLSLLDGTKAEGFPQGAYRQPATMTARTSLVINLPKGEPLVVTTTVQKAEWSELDRQRKPLPPDKAMLTLRGTREVDIPCCEVAISKNKTRYVLRVGNTDYEPLVQLDSGDLLTSGRLQFVVPAVTSRAELIMNVDIDSDPAIDETYTDTVELTLP